MTHTDEDLLRRRVGEYHYRLRTRIEAYHAAQVIGQGLTWLHPENVPYLRALLHFGLGCTGLYWRGYRAARTIHVRERRLALPRLPEAFLGFRILHLSDLHIDFHRPITDALIERVQGLHYDVSVITGDIRGETWGDFDATLREMERLMPHLRPPVYGILGNHDFIAMAPPLETMGLRMLLNEHVMIERGGAALCIAGIDDPHFYEADNFEKALGGVPPGAVKILLSHSAEPYLKALACGIDYMLCGHTHGGQIRLPWGRPLLRNAKQPLSMLYGPWEFETLRGYTTSGVGCSLAPIRLRAPAEIVIHQLDRGDT